jgi:hypothetical protein
MLSEEKLIAIYRDWPDSKLKAEFLNYEDYEPAAQKALEHVMLERGFSIERKKAEAFQDTTWSSPEETMQRNALDQSDVYQKSLKSLKSPEGVYFHKEMMIGSRSNLFGLAGALSIAGVVCVVVFAATEAVEVWINVLVILLSVLCAFWAYKLLVNNKSEFKLYERKGKLHITITVNDEEIELTEPFNYRCYARLEELHYKSTHVKRPNLYMLFEIPDGRTIMLNEDKPPTESMPHNWEEIGYKNNLLDNDLRLTQHGMKKLELDKLKVLLERLKN